MPVTTYVVAVATVAAAAAANAGGASWPSLTNSSFRARIEVREERAEPESGPGGKAQSATVAT